MQRIRKDANTATFFMSIDYTARPGGEVVCEKGVSSMTSVPNAITQPDLVGLDFLALQFMRE